jgi:hypothetical protein
MQFDEAQYVENFVKKHRGTRGVPGDPMARYAITLPATDVEIAAQVKAVREYWNKASRGMSNISQVAKLCRAEDERLRAQHGTKMETRAWWLERQSDQQKAAEASITVMVDDLRRHYGTLGVVTPGVLNQFAAKLGLTPAQATQAAERAGLKVITGLSLPDTEPIGNFAALLKSMSECAVPSVPELVHPGSGPFSLVDRYECRSYPEKRLDVSAVEAQCAEADRRGISATEDARRSALKIVRKAVRDGVDLRDVALYHMVTIARESLSLSIDMAAEELRKTGLEAADAAAIAVLVAEQNTRAGGAGKDRVDSLLASGRLREARAAAMGLQAESGLRSDAMQLVDAAQRRLDRLLSEAEAALRVPDEARAETLLKDAALISAEDAAVKLATVPLPPPAELRVACEGTAVKLFWRSGPGHDADTIYALRRTTQQRPPSAPTEGEPVSRDRGDTCTDPHAPVARPVQYGVFALGDGRPSSRAATASVTLLPPVSQLKAEVGPTTVALHWSAHPDAEVRVTRTVPGSCPVPVPVTGSGCQVTGLAEGQRQHFEVTAVYRGPGGIELRSASEDITATPRSEAHPLPKLRVRPVEVDGTVRVRVTWTPVDNSDVKIMRCDTEPTWPFGKIVAAEQMAGVGAEVTGRVISAGRETGFETELPAGVHRLVPFSIGGTGIVVGRATTIAVTEPVRQLVVTPFADYATLSWEWPPSTQLVEVSWEVDGNPDVVLLSRAQYRSAGGARVPLGRGPCRIEVRAVIMIGDTSFTSPPVHAEITHVVESAVRYQVFDLMPSIGPLGGRSKKVVFTAEQACAGVQVRMVAFPGRVMPTSASDGVPILETTLALRPGVPEERKATAVPRSIKRPFWVRCFVIGGQARLIDPPITSLKET